MTVTFVVIRLNYWDKPPYHLVERFVDTPERITNQIVSLGNVRPPVIPAVRVEPARQLLLAILANHERHHGNTALSSDTVVRLLRDGGDQVCLMAISREEDKAGLLGASETAFKATVQTTFAILIGYLS